MAAAPRQRDDSKPSLAALETFPVSTVDGVLVTGAYLWLECTLERVISGFGDNSLIIGSVAGTLGKVLHSKLASVSGSAGAGG